ncbi:hypothetical protein DOTSEDRAFT_96380 [Lecanosticta acicola]|uniref:Mediator of RNA polymerase II transcription subunit 9 n=1 Tax=Lecanosticta acicola TaxID=111012 RepID=A0AAI8Z7P4_9PEZI|nr:hypothetical protein DOTSEDRAFT_96380 [Lecanosticta acicola]
MALKQPIKTTTNSTPASNVQTLQLPKPQNLDLLPALHELLARVDAHNNKVFTTEDHHTLEDGSTDIGSDYVHCDPLNPKDLPTATLEIKGRIRAALREIERLPDVDRSLEEQEEEIQELEEKIRKQREMLRKLADVAKGAEGKMG